MLRLDALDMMRTGRRKAADKAALSAQQPRQIVLILESRRAFWLASISPDWPCGADAAASEDLAEDDGEDFDLFVGTSGGRWSAKRAEQDRDHNGFHFKFPQRKRNSATMQKLSKNRSTKRSLNSIDSSQAGPRPSCQGEK